MLSRLKNSNSLDTSYISNLDFIKNISNNEKRRFFLNIKELNFNKFSKSFDKFKINREENIFCLIFTPFFYNHKKLSDEIFSIMKEDFKESEILEIFVITFLSNQPDLILSIEYEDYDQLLNRFNIENYLSILQVIKVCKNSLNVFILMNLFLYYFEKNNISNEDLIKNFKYYLKTSEEILGFQNILTIELLKELNINNFKKDISILKLISLQQKLDDEDTVKFDEKNETNKKFCLSNKNKALVEKFNITNVNNYQIIFNICNNLCLEGDYHKIYYYLSFLSAETMITKSCVTFEIFEKFFKKKIITLIINILKNNSFGNEILTISDMIQNDNLQKKREIMILILELSIHFFELYKHFFKIDYKIEEDLEEFNKLKVDNEDDDIFNSIEKLKEFIKNTTNKNFDEILSLMKFLKFILKIEKIIDLKLYEIFQRETINYFYKQNSNEKQINSQALMKNRNNFIQYLLINNEFNTALKLSNSLGITKDFVQIEYIKILYENYDDENAEEIYMLLEDKNKGCKELIEICRKRLGLVLQFISNDKKKIHLMSYMSVQLFQWIQNVNNEHNINNQIEINDSFLKKIKVILEIVENCFIENQDTVEYKKSNQMLQFLSKIMK
jgi:hypothetical protein